jgi:hypothetical protein
MANATYTDGINIWTLDDISSGNSASWENLTRDEVRRIDGLEIGQSITIESDDGSITLTRAT